MMRWAFVDIDNTMIKTPALQRRARLAITKAGYTLCFVTSRTSETLISWSARQKSTTAVRARPEAMVYGDPAQHKPFTGLIDAPYIAATTGVELLIPQSNGGYRYDASWMKQFTSLGKPSTWLQHCQQYLIPEAGMQVPTDVAHPWYRLQLSFSTLRALRKQVRHLPKSISWQDESDPANGQYSIYLLPSGINKQTVVDHLIQQHDGVEDILIVGDSQTDQLMGFKAGAGYNVTFLIVGGARLPKLLSAKVKQSLRRTSQKGWYHYRDRTIIIGDQAFPGTIGPETIISYLQTQS